jgi:hypothetical protein
MAESKSAEYLNDIKDASEHSLAVRPLRILENFQRSEYPRQKLNVLRFQICRDDRQFHYNCIRVAIS